MRSPIRPTPRNIATKNTNAAISIYKPLFQIKREENYSTGDQRYDQRYHDQYAQRTVPGRFPNHLSRLTTAAPRFFSAGGRRGQFIAGGFVRRIDVKGPFHLSLVNPRLVRLGCR